MILLLAAMYSTLGLAGELAESYSGQLQELSGGLFIALFFGLIALGLFAGWRPRYAEFITLIAIFIVYAMVFVRMTTPAERTHLFEYGVVAVLIYQALLERKRNSGKVILPALSAILLASLFGAIDEGIQYFLPNRVFDWRDIGFNSFAAIIAICATSVLSQIRKPNSIARKT